MTLIRMTDINLDANVLVNPDHIVRVVPRHGPRGHATSALILRLTLTTGDPIDCFPLDPHGGFDSAVDDEATAITNMQRAVQHIRSHPELPQGAAS